MLLGLPENLSTLVARRFTAAKEANQIVFSKTQLTTLHASGIPYQLRYCPALAKKQNQAPKGDEKKGPKPDPFENPSPDLLLAEIPQEQPRYALVLNKFPVIPNHFILATKAWKSQTDILEKEDVEATYACLQNWGETTADGGQDRGLDAAKRLFAFYNSGEESGASQPHRHIQFLPVEAMRESESDAWRPLVDHFASEKVAKTGSGLLVLPQLPFMHFARDIPLNPSADVLYEIYLSLYRAAVTAARGASEDSSRTEGPAAISYNLAMTLSTMIICPRRSETAQLTIDPQKAGDVHQAGTLSLNGTILAGTLMVKAEAEWNELRSNPENLNAVLAAISFPRSDGTDPCS
ncbi:bis(5'-nucleosyl)-tetraphosphatase, putative [Paecilomyces variotii No. 5]|uniref:Bis(5'-nucleosyl)-tetraphosphatase, putative n=1 Tax=Byssochlamys spectabilis (strain No. 5 / NBRC 109023) TaxID=1356009 RepID=V5FZW4_BYSSN|nr:bis(5'-nucleosyl)-tetraphosphatase, putative [Paecilomyces variotii No. 5]